MKPLVFRVGTGVAAVAVAGVLIAASPHDVTRPRLEKSLNQTFTNLYVQQAKTLGHPGVSATSIGAQTTCHRTSSNNKDVGAGPDWICHVKWKDNTGTAQDGKFEVAAKANYCYVASGPSKIVGTLNITDARGRQVLNPLFEFDACYDPSS